MKKIISATMLAALSILFQLSPFWPTTWGMRIDLVAVPWFISLFLFGLWPGLLTAVITCIFIGLVAPSSWLGALMKFSATIPILLVIGLVQLKKFKPKLQTKLFFITFALAVIIRCVLMVYVNYYFALPIWLKLSTEQIMQQFPTYMIIVPNAVQSLIDFFIAWLIVFKTRLKGKIEV